VRGACITRDWNWVYFTGGAGLLLTPGDGFFLTVADRYRDSHYYRRTGIHGLLTVGTELSRRQTGHSAIASQGLFVEFTTIDEYLRLWWKSPRAEPFLATFSTSLGYRIGFR
jgi:hypothetical protein